MNTQSLKQTLSKYFVPNIGSIIIALLIVWGVTAYAEPSQTPASAVQDVPTTINYQGRLADTNGTPIDNPNPGLGMSFALYDAATDGSPLWSETHASVPVSEGLFNVKLGSINPLSYNLLNGDLWLGITVGNDAEMSPREKLSAVPYSMVAATALEVPDGSVTNAKLDLDGSLDLGSGSTEAILRGNYSNMRLHNGAGTLRLSASHSVLVFLDTNNIVEGEVFRILANHDYLESPVKSLFTLDASGNVSIPGSLSQGAMIENNLQTPTELTAERIERFSEGDVLCWADTRLEKCAQADDPLVQAVADVNGKPIVIGAELIKVAGPVQAGDLLVASDVPGYAVVNNNPRSGSVIAQALEDFEGELGLIRAMIRKF